MASNAQILYWDSCMFYEWLGSEQVAPGKFAAVQEILEANRKNENIILTSSISHLEVLPKKLDEKHFSDDQKYLKLFDGVHFVELEISSNILMRAREIRDFYYIAPVPANQFQCKMMDAADAIHLATASIYNCNEFHTRDNASHKTKIPLVTLYNWSGKKPLCGKYPLTILSPEDPQASFDLTPKKQNA